MKGISFRRKSVCMGDDALNGEYIINMPDDSTLGDLLYVVLHGGCGNDWPIPYTGADTHWVINTNIGKIADIFTDNSGEWHTEAMYDENTMLSELGIEWIFCSQIMIANKS